MVTFSALSTAIFVAWGVFLGAPTALVAIVAVVLLAAILRGLMDAKI